MAYRYAPSEQDLNMLKQRIKNVSIKIVILNKDFEILDFIKGNVVSDSYSINVESDIRRTYSLNLKITKDYDMLNIYKKLWIDKILDVYIGMQDLANNNEFVWYKFGRFTFDTANYEVSSDAYFLNINCLDLVAKYNGLLGGELFDQISIPAYDSETGEPNTIKGALIKVVTQLAGITKYDIGDMDKEIPYDLEYGRGSTIWQIITDLKNLYAGWEAYFDTDGVFVCSPIPTGEDDPIFLTEDVFNGMIINENDVEDASHIRNFSKLYGRSIDYDYYCDDVGVVKEENEGTVFKLDEDFFPTSYTEFKAFKLNKLPSKSEDVYFYTPGGNRPLYKIDTTPMDSLDKWYYLNQYQTYSRDKFSYYPNSYFTRELPTIYTPTSYEVKYEKIWIREDKAEYRKVLHLTVDGTIRDKYCIIWPDGIDYTHEDDSKYQKNDLYLVYVNGRYITTREINDEQDADKEKTNYNFKAGQVYLIERESWRTYRTKIETDSEGNKVEEEIRIDHWIDHINTVDLIENKAAEVMEKMIFELTSINTFNCVNGDIIALKPPVNPEIDLFMRQNNQTYYVCNNDLEPITAGMMKMGTLYLYKFSSNKFYFLGEQEIDIIAKEVLSIPTIEEREADMEKYQCADIIYCVDPESQFAIELIGERKKVYQDGDYAKIYSTDLGIERIVYENWKTTRLNTVSTIEIIAIPWLAGNEKIQYRKKVDGNLETYLIKQISGSTKEWTQTLTLAKFYPMIPNIIHSKWI